jgi:hypothetical protein
MSGSARAHAAARSPCAIVARQTRARAPDALPPRSCGVLAWPGMQLTHRSEAGRGVAAPRRRLIAMRIATSITGNKTPARRGAGGQGSRQQRSRPLRAHLARTQPEKETGVEVGAHRIA